MKKIQIVNWIVFQYFNKNKTLNKYLEEQPVYNRPYKLDAFYNHKSMCLFSTMQELCWLFQTSNICVQNIYHFSWSNMEA